MNESEVDATISVDKMLSSVVAAMSASKGARK